MKKISRRDFNRYVGLGALTSHAQGTAAAPLWGSEGSDSQNKKGCYVHFNEAIKTWSLGNELFERRVRISPSGEFQLDLLKDKVSGLLWISPQMPVSADFYLFQGLPGRWPRSGRIYRNLKPPDFSYRGQEVKQLPDGAYELKIEFLSSATNLVVKLFYRCFPGTTVVEQWCELENLGNDPWPGVQRFDSLTMEIPQVFSRPRLHWLQGVQEGGYGGLGLDIQPLQTFRLRQEELAKNGALHLANGHRSSQIHLPWFVLEDADKKAGIFGGLKWSGAWQIHVARKGGRVFVSVGMREFSHNLPPASNIESPHAFLGLYRGDLDSASREQFKYLQSQVVLPVPKDFPWVAYNTWYNHRISIEEKGLRKEARLAQALGMECFYIDAGWYKGSPSEKGGNFGVGLGTWVENRHKFPSGLQAFADYVHGLGMKFGIWVEPERADLQWVGKGKPVKDSWLARRDGHRITRGNRTGQICFGNPEVVAWAKDRISRIIEDYRVDWIKWDHNLYEFCNSADHGHQAGDGNYRHILGVYEVLRFLRERFPQLIQENCSSGGHRFEFGMMEHSHLSWTSDYTFPSHRVRYYAEGISHAFPGRYQFSWYIKRTQESEDAEHSPEFFLYLLRSRMMGSFGVSDTLGQWSESMKDTARRAIREFKEIRRTLEGDVYHLLPQATLFGPDLDPPTQWEAMEYCLPEEQFAVLFVFRPDADSTSIRLPVRGLGRASSYKIKFFNSGQEKTISANELKQGGVRVTLPQKRTSEIVKIWL